MRISERVDNAVRAMARSPPPRAAPIKAEAIATASGHLGEVPARHPPRPQAGRTRPAGVAPTAASRSPDRPRDDLARRHLPRRRRSARRRARREPARSCATRRPPGAARGVDGGPGRACAACSRRVTLADLVAGELPPEVPGRSPPSTSTSTADATLVTDAADTICRRLAAVAAPATDLARGAQGRLLAGDTLTKGDHSPVTVADFAAQALVSCGAHRPARGDRDDRRGGVRRPATSGERRCSRSGVRRSCRRAQRHALSPSATVLDWIDLGDARRRRSGRVWTLDPIDGTKGFLRGDQYAIALALIEDGEVVLGVLGCPNLPNPDGSRGAMFVADARRVPGLVRSRRRRHRPASRWQRRRRWPTHASASRSSPGTPTTMHSARIVALLGITAEPYRIDSQCKYARGRPRRRLDLPAAADPGRLPSRRSGTTPPASSSSSRPGAGHRRRPARRSTSPHGAGSPPTAASSPPTAASTTTSSLRSAPAPDDRDCRLIR